MDTDNTLAPDIPFNFAAHLISVNHGRLDKLAFRDDKKDLSYGDLADATKRMAAGLTISSY